MRHVRALVEPELFDDSSELWELARMLRVSGSSLELGGISTQLVRTYFIPT